MTSQEKKEILQRYREAEKEADRIEQEIMRWYSKSERMTTALKMVPGGSGGGRSLENSIEVIDLLADKLGAQRLKTVRLRQGIGAAIESVEDTRLRQLLRYRYIDGMAWEQVAEMMNFRDVRQVYNLHGKALAEILESSLNFMLSI